MRDRIAQTRAKALRKHSTDAERYLWTHLRQRQLEGFRFRRQVPVSSYIADFACIEAGLIIELDGGQHQLQARYDEQRDAAIEICGFRVLRFWNNQVFEEMPAVLEVILQALREARELLPPP